LRGAVEHAHPLVPVAHYVIAGGCEADAPLGFGEPWILSPSIPRDALEKMRGPHDGGFNVLHNNESVFWQRRTTDPVTDYVE
jgi:hypothetical protein